jgi:quinol monooxygenase YgiN
MLTVIATAQAKPGSEGKLEQELWALIPPTIEEEGCINYDLLRALGKPGKFVCYQNWESQEALNKHLSSDLMKTFLAEAKPLVVGSVEFELYEIAD